MTSLLEDFRNSNFLLDNREYANHQKLFFCGGQKKPPLEDYSSVFNIKGCQNKREGLQNYDTLVYGRECQNN